jgi:hypothetical protein
MSFSVFSRLCICFIYSLQVTDTLQVGSIASAVVGVINLSDFNAFVYQLAIYLHYLEPVSWKLQARCTICTLQEYWKKLSYLGRWCEFEGCELTTLATGREKMKVLLLSLLTVGLFIFWSRVKWFYRGTSEIFAVRWIFPEVAPPFTGFVSACISPVLSVMYCDNRSENNLTLHILYCDFFTCNCYNAILISFCFSPTNFAHSSKQTSDFYHVVVLSLLSPVHRNALNSVSAMTSQLFASGDHV